MSKVAVVYWSGTGNTGIMAEAVADGAKEAGAEVTVAEVADFAAADAAGYDGIALGCPAMGAEVLEEDEFQPFFDEVKDSIADKKVVIFGSYGWGDGEWIRTWAEDCEAAGITLAADPVMANEEPDDDAKAECKAAGAAIA